MTRDRIEQVLGVDLSTTQVRTALTDLGFGCRWVPPDRYVVRAPYWRTDVTQADDVVEELARVVGLRQAGVAAAGGRDPAAAMSTRCATCASACATLPWRPDCRRSSPTR